MSDSSYIILSIRVPCSIGEALDSASDIVRLMKLQGIEDVIILNTIRAPNKES